MVRYSLVWQLFLAFGLLIVVALGLLGLVVESRMRHAGLQAIEERLRDKAALLNELVRGQNLEQMRQRLNGLHDEFGMRITLIAADGQVLAETDRDDLERLENHSQRPEIVAAKTKPFGMATRHSFTIGKDMMYVARRVDASDSPIGFVRLALPVADIDGQIGQLQRLVWTTAGITAILALGLAWGLAQRVARPMQELRRAAASVANGEYGQKVYIERHDELGALASAFNQMSLRLATQFSQLDQDRQQLRAVLESMVEGVIAVDARQNILFANDRAAQLLEFRISEAVGRGLWTVLRHRAIHALVDRLLSADDVGGRSLEWNAPGHRLFAVYGAPLPGQPVPGAVLVLHDVTEMRRLERVRQEFVANVSHELKTPLSVIVACAETLQNGGMDDLEHRGRFLERIMTQSQQLLALIVDMINLARIESGVEQFEPTAVALEDAVHACVERHQERARSRQQRLEAAPPAQSPPGGVIAWVDDDALSHILDNLVDNAIKYTPAEGVIQIHWWAEEGSAVVEVRDTGIGIPEAELSRIFERFFRVDKARSREMGGTGLGLSIVKHLVQAMDGSVRVASQPGQGSAFTVVLPQPQ